MPSIPVSVIIIAQNEADRIGLAIESVRAWVAEVIVVDSGSTDGTQALAEALGARVIHNDWPGYGQQKRFAEEQARHDWILNIDADERILPELQAEMVELFQPPGPAADGYYIAIHDRLYCTNQLSSYTPYKPIRLYRKSRGRYSPSPVHDRVQMDAGTSTDSLNGKMAHDSLKSFHHRVEKMNDYSEAQARDLLTRGRRPSKLRMITELWSAFITGYFFRGYWRGGLMGYIYAVNFAYSRFLRQIKLYEADHRQNPPD
ncbi:glycosyltransferase family 2 protein [Marinobacterium marinum]|uniref:Glycosyltransferase family 2 protein n=1 Tax=Marinobacterium marinum TaxID=2756129 RepID=A0A7W1X0J1_9GAMM|nr:glycosyltransferase family 2 protein [Marinobacterium marinum]MBA4503635.1 glycosyltransferase family 2 protein [Marinobacterium marinum]